jgi:hypothetical protein
MTSVSRPRPLRNGPERTFLAIFGFALVALIQSSWRWALVHAATTDYLIVLSIAGVLVFARLRLREGFGFSARPSLTTLALWFIVAGGVAGDSLLCANALLDRGPTREFTTLAAGEHCGSRGSDITVSGAPRLPVMAGTMQVNVPRSVCRATRDGDTIVVVVGPGYFGRAWVQDARTVQGVTQ